eukprot:CAMPEP_0182435568 /NCGR_PEP_ID=MMETSP1167-20130531/76517_1 /TAXON_ID=2988 /ORGANISM="Mallomonas Sp, Strain CCMP3275" /LENGTH=33 /DNA_ID= /DNA_START= /DNA_END= /DNA_ORIENTATION=
MNSEGDIDTDWDEEGEAGEPDVLCCISEDDAVK